MHDEDIEWGDDNCLILNADKIKTMIVLELQYSVISPVIFNTGNSQILFVTNFNNLGILDFLRKF